MARTIAVIGGGYGGAAVAKALDTDHDVVLVEPKDAFVHAAAALRALVRPDWAESMFFPYERLLARGTVIRERATAVTSAGVTLASGRYVPADHLVIATGSGYPYPAKPDTDDTREALDRLRDTHAALADAGRVLITGAGPVGLELAGEILAVWPDKQITVVDPADRLVPGYLPAVRDELHRQLDALGVRLLLGTRLAEDPPADPGVAKTFTVASTGVELTADIWFRCHGVRPTADVLAGDLAGARNERGEVRVTERLSVVGHDHVYAVGDVTDAPGEKRAGAASRHAAVVVENIGAQARGETPTAAYRPGPPTMLLPLGPDGGVGQMATPDGPVAVPTSTVTEYKGAGLMIGRFREMFGRD
ncbi:NAD(P)/FAD-dependent oxidoreductase [Actinocatenispora rupis]|uniref:FAD/NAD(P)-binding domain-containing protein n=1 Tax=Actinocatenispora rupis TaxID=519421 RepID=A0A8J3J6U6_9ACTN|nr:FAD-dependent oxidoreductase [Actinocatenispora rupis]GID12691.1 hypothetical protein Aru02nite_35800 [Actinocatenispora rupis]